MTIWTSSTSDSSSLLSVLDGSPTMLVAIVIAGYAVFLGVLVALSDGFVGWWESIRSRSAFDRHVAQDAS